MTRAPLPGKLPEWPTIDFVKGVLNEHYNRDNWGIGHDRELAERRAWYWERRCRLAVKALKTIEVISNYHGSMHKQSWVEAHNALEAICPLPEEDRT